MRKRPHPSAAAPVRKLRHEFREHAVVSELSGTRIFRPMFPRSKMSNSERLHSLLSDGKLHLSLQDVVELALENNLDIAVARYTIAYSHTDLLRTQGGGAARGFNGSFTSSALYSGAVGSGVSASSSGVSSGTGGASGSASATELGGGHFDPTAFFSIGWNRNTHAPWEPP